MDIQYSLHFPRPDILIQYLLHFQKPNILKYSENTKYVQPTSICYNTGLDDVTSPCPRHGWEAALLADLTILHHHQLHSVGEAVHGVIATRDDQT